MKNNVLLIFSVIALCLFGCSKTDETDTYKSHEQPMAETEEVFTLGLYDNNEFEYERTFQIEENAFSKDIVIGNKTSKKESFVLIIFNHGEQIDFELEDKDVHGKNYKFEIEPDEYVKLPISLSNLKEDYNSVTYMLLKKPDEAIGDPDKSMELADAFSIRVNLLNGIDEIPKERPKLYDKSIINPERSTHGALVGEKGEMYKIKFLEENHTNNNSYSLVYGNSSSQDLDFYLVGLNDYEQVPIGEENYIYDNLIPDQEKHLSLNYNFNIDKESDFQVIMITSPFQSVTEDNPFLLEDPLVSNRVHLKQ